MKATSTLPKCPAGASAAALELPPSDDKPLWSLFASDPLRFRRNATPLSAFSSSIKYNSNQFLMQTLLPLSRIGRAVLCLPNGLYYAVLSIMLLLGMSGNSIAATINVPGDQPTISAAVAAASPGDVILLAPGNYTEQVNLNKSVTIDGGDKSTTFLKGDITFPLLAGGRYFILISGAGAGSTIRNITFEKLDKAGVQNIIGLQAANVTFNDCDFLGQYVLGDPDVSRAFEVSGSATGFLIQNCSITNLRQPGYFNPGSSGSITNCYVHNTRGWVIDNGSVTFSGNTFGTNAVDIALLAGTILGSPYDPLSTLSANNGGASISDQRSYVAYNITQSTSHATIQAAVDAAVNGDQIQVAPVTRNEMVSINKSITLQGANAGTSGSGIRATESIISNGGFTVLGANTVMIDGFHILNTNNTDPLTLSGSSIVTIQNCLIERNGISTGTPIRAITFQAGGAGAKTIRGNKFTGDTSGGLFGGHKTWNNGLYININTAAITVENNVFQNCRTAVNFDDIDSYGATLTVSGNTFDNNGTHVSIGGTSPQAGSYTWGANDFKTPASATINLSNVSTAFRLNIASSTFNGTAFGSLPLATLFGVETTMYHRGVGSRNGLVTYVSNNQYVVTPFNPSIQLAIDYAAAGNVINIADGTYNQRLTVSKALTLDGQSKAGTILNGTGLVGMGSGITINTGITNVTIKDLTVQNYAGVDPNSSAGIYAVQNNNNLTVDNVTIQNNTNAAGFYANGLGSGINNVNITNSMVSNHGPGARGIVIWNGHKTNITITNNMVTNNNCCGIEMQDGSASAVNVSGNTIDIGSGDNAIGLTGMDESVGPNVVNNNIITGGGRYGIEIKNPAGGVTVSGNSVTLSTQNADLRDRGGIIIMRRGVLPSPPNIFNVDVPNGVNITGNTVSGYQQTSTSEGFGIVVEGINHTVTGNTVSNCDVGILQQQNPNGYPNDADQSNLADQFFGRGNSPMTCGNTISGNTFSGNAANTRNIGVGGGLVTNTNTSEVFCSIQSAINDPQTLNGHTLSVSAGTYNEAITITKELTIEGVSTNAIIKAPYNAATNTVTINANNVTLRKLTITRDFGATLAEWYACTVNQGINYNSRSNVTLDQLVITGNRNGIFCNNSPNTTITKCTIEDNRTGIQLGNNVSGGVIANNFFRNNFTHGLMINFDLGAVNGNNLQVNNNNFSGNWYSEVYFNGANSGTFTGADFSCNWYGTASVTVDATPAGEPGYGAQAPSQFSGMAPSPLANPVRGNQAGLINLLLWLVSGTDFVPATPGFQPTPLSCTGGCPGGGVVINTNTSAIFCSIQDAINDPLTVDGHTITASAGTYAENVTVNKSITLNGPNANATSCSGRVAEAIISPAGGVPITVTADNVTINGFEVTAPSSVYGINFGNTSGVSIKSNRIHSIGTSVTNANVHAVLYSVTSASRSNAFITDNCISNISSTALTGWSASAIGILQSASTGVLTGLNIERNTIDDVQVNTGDWPTGKIAYGITINVGGGGSYLTTSGEVVDAVIRDNEISNLSGFIATGIGLEGNTKNALVENNSVAGLYGRKVGGTRAAGGYDLSALKFENNRWVGTVTVRNNSFQTNTFTHDVTAGRGYAVSNYVPAGVAFTGGGGGTTGQATVSCNWLGTASYSTIQDNPALDGKIFNKDNCITNFVPYLVNDTDNSAAIGFQPHPTACYGGPVQVYNGNTFVSVHATIQDAIDAVTTLSGYTVRIASGTYVENVDAVTGGKSLIFAPGASPGCVTITGNLMLNAGDVLEIEIDGTTACTQHDQFIVTGTVTLGGATITVPAGMYFAQPGDAIKIIDGASPIAGIFAQGNFVSDGLNVNSYYINYSGGDGNDVVLTKCCTGLLDLGIFNYTAPAPAGNKLQVFVKPNVDVINGPYSAGKFTIRTLTSNMVTFTNLGATPYSYTQVNQLTDGLYTYYLFNYEQVPPLVNWTAGSEILLLTLSYSCVGNATFELINDAFTIANNGDYYQELGGADAQGIFYQPSAISPAALTITATNNGPLCESMPIDLNSTTSGGSPLPIPTYTYVWAGPDTYSNTVADPAPFASTLAKAGIYTVTVTDANGCTATATTDVVVLNNSGCVKNVDLVTYYPTITQAINVPETINGHTLEVPAGNWPENVDVTKELTINGANAGVPCTGTRVAESIIYGGLGTAVTISSNGVTIDGFQINGGTGVSSSSYTDISIVNNKVNAEVIGISSALVSTTLTLGYTIQDNCVDLTRQAYTTIGFDANPTLSSSQAPGVWYTDRYAPAGFVAEVFGGNSRLKHSISAADCESCRPGGFTTAFYNTQGRKYDSPGATAMGIELYVPADWATTNRRMAGFWGTAFDAGNAISFYPILEFTSDGGVPRFRAWNGTGWQDLGLPNKFAYDKWYTLKIEVLGANIVYSVGDLSLSLPGNSSVTIGNVILQGHNTPTPGVTYDIYWDNLLLSTNGAAGAVATTPTTGIALTAASGTQAVVLQNNHISDAFYGYVLFDVDAGTLPARTTVRGGTFTNLMQGVAVTNTLDGVTYLPSIVGVEDLSMSSFTGDHPAIPAANFHSGVYAFTGGGDNLAVVDVFIEDVSVSNTGKTSQASSGLYFADFSTGAGTRINAVVNRADVLDNKNRGVQARGTNAKLTMTNSEIRRNGGDPFGLGGNDGFGVYAGVGADVTLSNNYIQNPMTQVGYQVTALFIGVAPAAKITAYENHITRNGNGSLTGNTYPIAQFTATCNWWGDADIDDVDALVDGNVLFVPYLNSGTDTDVAKGFQQSPLSCVNPAHWYVNDDALTDDVYTLGLGNDLNQGTKRRPFRTISKAVTTVQTTTSPVPGPNNNTIYVDAGMYNEQVVVPSTIGNLLIKGVGPCNAISPALTTMVDFTGTVMGKPTLFDIAGNGTVIDGIHFKVDLSKLNSAIIASHSALDDITIINNCIDPYHSIANTYFGSYGNRNAISINYSGPTNYRVAAGGVNNILVDNNRVTATVTPPFIGDADDIAFRSAVSVDEGAGTYTRNTFQSINHDILIRSNSNGPVVIGGSVPNANTFLGGGVQYSDPNAGGGAVTISHNSFNGTVVPGSVLRLQNNYHNAPVSVANNTLSNLRWGMSLENFRNVTVADNVLSPLAGLSNFRLITVNTKSISTNSATIVQVPIDGVFTGNTFNAGTPGTGTAIAFYNHDSDNAVLNNFTVGTALSPNTFASGFLYAVYLGDQMGLTTDAPALALFPEYNLGAGSTTPMACWDKDIDIQNNTFDVGTGPKIPPTMNNAERTALEVILYHKPDNSCLGVLIYFMPVLVDAKVFLQGPYDSLTGLMKDNLRAANLLPASEPFTGINTANPGSFVEVNNFVTETIANPMMVLADKAPMDGNSIVDWVWLELRDKNNSGTVVATRSALVQRDGDIVDLDGFSEVEFPDTYVGEYYLYVRHRNHLGVMTAAAVDFTSVPFIDFTIAAQPTFGSTATSARRLIQTGIYGLYAGNTIPRSAGGFQLIYNGGSNDRLPILNYIGDTTPLNVISNVYTLEDVNLDGQVKYNGANNDRVIILNNIGSSTPLNVITQQPNN